MEIRTLEIGGFGPAMEALRLPRNGQSKSDSVIEHHGYYGEYLDKDNPEPLKAVKSNFMVAIGKKDMSLARNLVKASDCEAKVMRGIIVWVEIEAPIHWWCEAETYRAGHERLCSASTMNTEGKGLSGQELSDALEKISFARPLKKIDFFSYQCLRNIWIWRHKHRKDEWRQFCKWIESLPFAEELILAGTDFDKENND